MKAAVLYQPGAPDVFRYEEIPDPVPGPDGVLVRVEAISIEGGDTLHRAHGQAGAAPHVVGYQAAGTVLAGGSQLTGLQKATGW
jgi:NADPH2:quinone reductase